LEHRRPESAQPDPRADRDPVILVSSSSVSIPVLSALLIA
jgi:hypothetical protein